MEVLAYNYGNLPIPGGGYVTGFLFHPKKENVFYIRTDIGGTYRFGADHKWHSLIDHVTMEDLGETFPIALALDEEDPEKLYIVCGENKPGRAKIAVSEDGGKSFSYYKMPCLVHGNLNGRGTGYRLIKDKKAKDTLWFASQKDGLFKSCDDGKSWDSCAYFNGEYMTFIGQDPTGEILFAATAGIAKKRGDCLRGHSLFVSYDGGESFEPLWQPADGSVEGVKLAGLIGQRYAMDEKYLYVTYSVMGRNAYVYELGYSCDGGSVIGGKVVRYPFLTDGKIGQGEDITPDRSSELLEYGFSGIDTTKEVAGLLVTSTICKDDGDCIFRSFDYGKTWQCIMWDLNIGTMAFRTSYMTPQYNGGHSIVHWMTDLKINPFDKDQVWFNTGTGVFRSKNLLDETVIFEDYSDGIEETVHLNLYSPPAGDVKCIDILGDLGGFAFTQLDKPCDNSFADENGNRYITCINADYSDLHPETVIVTPRGNWTGKTKGGLILSKDQCKTFTRLQMPFGISKKLDKALASIETPNVNSGWVAMSPDCDHIVWSVATHIELPIDQVIVSHDRGAHFEKVTVFDLEHQVKTDGGMKVFADRTDSTLFYGFGDKGEVYISEDSGDHFEQIPCPELQKIQFALIDCANKTEIRGESGKTGVFYIAASDKGLWKMQYDKTDKHLALQKLSKDGDVVYRMGLGVIRPGGSYMEENKAIYMAAVIDGVYGFYRTIDDGESYVRLNNEKQMFGEIISMEGDSQVYGRFYLATGSRGVVYGEPGESL